jgi:hypothetical protein
MARTRVQFSPNVPHDLLVLADSEGVPVDDDWTTMSFPLVDGRDLIVPRQVAISMNMLELKPFVETFSLCKYHNGERRQQARGNVWLSNDTERDRAAALKSLGPFQYPETGILPKLRQSIVAASESKGVFTGPPPTPVQPQPPIAAPPIPDDAFQRFAPVKLIVPPAPITPAASLPPLPAEEPLANGTHGPQRLPRRVVPIPTKVPFNIAFVEVSRLVRDGLKEIGEQWSDSSRQDAVSTILISATKAGWITIWDRSQAE